MERDDEILKKYIEKVFTLKNQDKEDIPDLKGIARELGLTSADFQKIDSQMKEHLTRGHNFSDNHFFEEALGEYESAYTLSPFDTEILYGLSYAHYQLWLKNRKSDHRKKAALFARKCIKISPANKSAYKLLKALDVKKKKDSRPMAKILGLFFLLLGGIFFYILFTPESSRQSTPWKEEPAAVSSSTSAEYSVPVNFKKGESARFLELTTRSSAANQSSYGFSYTYKGDITVTGNELTRLNLKLSLLNSKGALILSKHVEVLKSYPVIMPGNTLPFHISIYEKERELNITQGILEVDFIESEKAPEGYAEFKKLPLVWETPQSSLFDLELFERNNTFSSGRYHRLTFELKNSGTASIASLKLKIDWFDKDNRPIESNTFYGATSSGPTFLPGQVRAIFRIQSLKVLPPPENYKVSVIEIDR